MRAQSIARARGRFVALIALLAIAMVALLSRDASAHGMRTGYLEVTERTPGHALVVFRVTVPDAMTAPEIDAGCTISSGEDVQGLGGALARTYTMACEGPIAGHTISVRGLGPVIGEATVRVALADGREESGLVTAQQPGFAIPEVATNGRVLARYLRLGVAHILTGPDHLLFLVGLVLLVRRARAVLVTETAFTLSHSLSFSATALGLVHVSPSAAEACIALSLVLVALDIEMSPSKAPRVSHGAKLAFVFGLVHGLGFAGGLSELGLPDGYAATALVGFGAGVEVGQVLFLCVLLVVLHLARTTRIARFIPAVGTYAIGGVGAFWLLERSLAVLFH